MVLSPAGSFPGFAASGPVELSRAASGTGGGGSPGPLSPSHSGAQALPPSGASNGQQHHPQQQQQLQQLQQQQQLQHHHPAPAFASPALVVQQGGSSSGGGGNSWAVHSQLMQYNLSTPNRGPAQIVSDWMSTQVNLKP